MIKIIETQYFPNYYEIFHVLSVTSIWLFKYDCIGCPLCEETGKFTIRPLDRFRPYVVFNTGELLTKYNNVNVSIREIPGVY